MSILLPIRVPRLEILFRCNAPACQDTILKILR